MRIVCLLLIFMACHLATGQELSIPKVYDTDLLTKEFHQGSRTELAKRLLPNSLVLLLASEQRIRSEASYYNYRYNNNIYYLTGMQESDCAFMFIPDGIRLADGGKPIFSVLFVNPRDLDKETRNGRRFGTSGTMQILGVDTAFVNDDFALIFKKITTQLSANKKLDNVYLPDIYTAIEHQPLKRMTEVLLKYRSDQTGDRKFHDIDPIVNEMRSIKTEDEIKLLKKAIGISVDGHIQMMKSTEPGMFEYEARAVGEYIFTKNGSEHEGYGSICGAGENSVILHYRPNRKPMKDGELLLIDMAAEYHGYTADVTRTFPVNGKFSTEQLAIYQIVLNAQKAGITMIKPGANYGEVSAKITEVLENGLLDLGLIKDRKEAKRYTLHGYMHSIGLNVHDPQGFATDFSPGYFTTVEPGIYIPEGSPVDKKWWNIGVRIEDDILITTDGAINLSEKAPREPKEIEALMKKKGIGNIPLDYEK
ncbi:aminopeptidase P family protein [bacterium]|nr:aminopeptidase P family protein [bacterium]